MAMETKRFLRHLLVGTGGLLLLFLIPVHVPLLGVMLIITPLPVMLLYHLWGLRGGGLAVLIGTLVISTVLTPFFGVIFLIEFGLLGIFLYHYVVRRELPWDHGILFSSLIVLGMLTLLVLIHRMATPFNVVDWMRGEIHETGRALLQPQALEAAADQPSGIALEKLTRFVLRIFPALIILSIWLEGIVNVSLFTRITNRPTFSDRRVTMRPEFSTWICPDRFVWGGIVGGFLMVTRVPPLVTIGINAVILMGALYFFQGVAIVSFLFKKKKVPLGFRVMGYILIGLSQFLPIVVAALGLFDIWIDFRKVRPGVVAFRKSP